MRIVKLMREVTKCGERRDHMIVWKELKISFQSEMLDKYNNA